MLDDAGQAELSELTQSLRRSVIARHVGSLAPRIHEPLEFLLDAFVRTNACGTIAAYLYLDGELALPKLEIPESERDSFLLFIWGHTMTAMMEKGASTSPTGAYLPDVLAGLSAAADCAAVLAYEPWLLAPQDRSLLPELLDRLSSSYAVGVSIAWAGRTATSPKDVQRVRTALRRLAPEDRTLIEERYAKRRSSEEMARTRGWDQKDVAPAMGEALKRLREACQAS